METTISKAERRDIPEAVKIYEIPVDEVGGVPFFNHYFGCPVCRIELSERWNYCPNCGQKVKW